jgi:hypothetical protein
MGDSEQPKKAALSFEVPDLELAPVRRAGSQALPAQVENRRVEYSGQNLFDEEAFSAGSPTLELAGEHQPPAATNLGPNLELDLEARGGPELQANTAASDAREPESEAHRARTSNVSAEEIRLVANYGDAPTSVYLTPAYAYRVFRRKRELRRALGILQSECTRATRERQRAERAPSDDAAAQRATAQAQALALRSELYTRALTAYDRARVAQGVRLACTATAIVICLILLKIAL